MPVCPPRQLCSSPSRYSMWYRCCTLECPRNTLCIPSAGQRRSCTVPQHSRKSGLFNVGIKHTLWEWRFVLPTTAQISGSPWSCLAATAVCSGVGGKVKRWGSSRKGCDGAFVGTATVVSPPRRLAPTPRTRETDINVQNILTAAMTSSSSSPVLQSDFL